MGKQDRSGAARVTGALMSTLLIRLIAPMQSWGVQSRYDLRDSGREPSKSGVIGLLCAALGRPRWQSIDDLASLRMGVRIDREGTMKWDYQTVKNTAKPVVSQRAYLSDAAFLVGLEGDPALLQTLQHALQHPVWCLYLGRKAFPPAEPVWLPDGLRTGEDLAVVLTCYPRLVPAMDDGDLRLRLVLDDPKNGEMTITDSPISFLPRRYANRRVRTEFVEIPLQSGA